MIYDITERKKATEVLRKSEEKYKKIFDLSPEGIALMDKKGRLLDGNERLYDWAGYKPEEVIGKNLIEMPFFTEESRAKIIKNFSERIKGKEIPSYEIDFISKNGEKRFARIIGSAIRDKNGKIIEDIVMISDITENKKAEENLRMLKEKYENLYNNAPVMYISLNMGGRIIECNNPILNKQGYTKREFIDTHITKFTTKESAAKFKRDFPEMLKMGKLLGVERRLVTKNGKVIDVILNVTV